MYEMESAHGEIFDGVIFGGMLKYFVSSEQIQTHIKNMIILFVKARTQIETCHDGKININRKLKTMKIFKYYLIFNKN